MTQALDSLRAVIGLGGPVIVVLMAMSVVSLAVILFKLWQFRRLPAARAALARLDLGPDPDPGASPLPLAAELRAVVTSRLAPADLRDSGETVIAAGVSRLQGGFRLLDSVAQAAPLLGLLGTVLGMIEAFRALEGAGAAVDPALLAGGIWVALTTTAAGLALAIPVQLMLTWFEARLDRLDTAARLALDRCARAAPGQGGRRAGGHAQGPVAPKGARHAGVAAAPHPGGGG